MYKNSNFPQGLLKDKTSYNTYFCQRRVVLACCDDQAFYSDAQGSEVTLGERKISKIMIMK